jgi:hypothetical protein
MQVPNASLTPGVLQSPTGGEGESKGKEYGEGMAFFNFGSGS